MQTSTRSEVTGRIIDHEHLINTGPQFSLETTTNACLRLQITELKLTAKCSKVSNHVSFV